MSKKAFTENPFFTPTSASFNRYLKLPYILLSEELTKRNDPLSYLEAFILILSEVRYTDTEEGLGADKNRCRTGESFHSLQAWSKLFHWNRSKTYRYLNSLEAQGIIELENMGNTTRLRVIQYNLYVGKPTTTDAKTAYTEDFEAFWKAYHRITLMRAVDKHAAAKSWSKLCQTEREKALTSITRYYYSLAKTNYCAKALTYLTNKKFNDQLYY